MHIHYIQHVPFETPAYIQTWATDRGHNFTGTKLYEEVDFPSSDEIGGLIVMGGPMSVTDDHLHSWLKTEKQFIKRCIDRKKKVLGICLGAQLIADVLGADVQPMPTKEIGWFPIRWAEAARQHPLLNFLPVEQTVLHWHGDQFKLPTGALSLASSEGCSNQGFLLGDYVLGLQFHLEMTKIGLAKLINHGEDELTGGPYLQDAETMIKNPFFEENHQMMHRLLDGFFAE